MSKDLSVFSPFEELNRRMFTNPFNFSEWRIPMIEDDEVKDNDDGSKTIAVRVPGATKDEVRLTYGDDGSISLNVDSHESKDGSYKSESLSRYWRVNDGDVSKASASLENGMLIIHVPKSEKSIDATHEIEVK